MLYSSCRNFVIHYTENEIKLNIDKKLETSDPDELTKTYILDELHPQTEETTTKTFSRPKPPGRRGNTRS